MAAQLSGPGGDSKFTIKQNSDINVTPFVDVMLVLLIIFMVAVPVPTLAIKLDLPPAVPNTVKPPKPPTVISLQESGAIFIGGKQTALGRIGPDVAADMGVPNPTQQSVYIRADKQVKYSTFMNVLNELQQDGYYKVSLVTEAA